MKKHIGGNVRPAIITVLSICLTLILIRQICDFIGRLWLPIFVNFAHILFLIFGLFGIVQYRSAFLIALSVWTPFWLGWNAFLICFYLNVGVLNRNSKVLSFGTRGAHSFWIERTPLCTNTYNLTSESWVPVNCYLDYFYIEVIVAAVHIVVALIVLFYAFFFLITYGRKFQESGVPYGTLSRHQPRVTVEFSDPPSKSTDFVNSDPNGKIPVANGQGANNPGYFSDSLYDASSMGYMNTSFESSPTPAKNGFVPNLNPSGPLVPNSGNVHSRASSKRKKKERRKSQDGLPRPNGAIYNRSSPSEEEPPSDSRENRISRHSENFSTAATVEIENAGPLRPRGRSNSASRARRDERERRKNRTRSISPVPSSRNSNRQDETMDSDSPSQRQVDHGYHIDQIHPYIRQRSNSAKQRPMKYRGHQAQALPKHGGSQDRMILGKKLASHMDSDDATDFSMQRYTAEPRRLSVTEPRGIRNSTDSALNGPTTSSPHKRNSRPSSLHQNSIVNQPLTSLISFDPKSNTLIRYHDHLARSREAMHSSRTTDESTSSAVVPPDMLIHTNGNLPNGYGQNQQQLNYYSIPPLGPPSDRVSYDSGHPSSAAPSSASTVGFSDQQIGKIAALARPDIYAGRQIGPQSLASLGSASEPVYMPNFMKRPSHPPPSYQSHYHHQPRQTPVSQPSPVQDLSGHDRFLHVYQNGPVIEDISELELPKANGYLPSGENQPYLTDGSSPSALDSIPETSPGYETHDSPPSVPLINDKSLLV